MNNREFRVKFCKLTDYNVGINKKVEDYLSKCGYKNFVLNELGEKRSIESVVRKLNEMENSKSFFQKRNKFYVRQGVGERKYFGIEEGY